MFEDSLMESQNRLSSPNQRWTTIVSFTLQCSLVAAVIALPLLHPDVLTFHTDAPIITLPIKPPMPRAPHIEATHSANTSSTPAAPPASGTPIPNVRNLGPINSTVDDAPPFANIGSMTGPGEFPGSIGTSPTGTGTRVSLAPASTAGPIHISRGVSAGLLLAPIRPVYPPIAISTRTEGVVVVEAIISKAGHIESAHATSGPPLLRNAALEAIRNARYSPYLLNGQPTEVETTITVNFKLAG
ncbi:protein TonB [Granulicella aggregans]|uniref:Protein TonB n=1 Tax=Granulicella aggregans TaxID=474949 RepID=A0A7W7Z8X8_9BACT|nr:energy transducer TonB [Granulicella aggregans]MBB5055363.1 protein TonB [Granulicella aggregans]